MNRRNNRTDLRQIPGIGRRMEQSLLALGYKSISSLKGANPEEMYEKACLLEGETLDRCVLYVYRCAVYFAEHEEWEIEKLKWWYWKDHVYQNLP